MAQEENNQDFIYDVSGPNPAEAAALAGNNAVIGHLDVTPVDDLDQNDITDSNETAASSATITAATDSTATTETVTEEIEVSIVDNNQAAIEPADVASSVHIGSATSVNDSMSFATAFATARAEMGPGASFTWHGKVYGTYYENEWKAMSPAEQHAFTADALAGRTPHMPHDNNSSSMPEVQLAERTTEDADLAIASSTDSDNQISIVGMETVEGPNGTVNLATFDIDGEAVVMIDLDNDNIYDYAMGDFDGSGQLFDSSADILDISSIGLSVDDVSDAMNGMSDIDLLNT